MEIEITADGTPTLYLPEIDEHYHSVKGAESESEHVYIGLGWEHVTRSKEGVRVFEVGFGTGLNASLTSLYALERHVMTEYIAVEKYPLGKEVGRQLAPLQPQRVRSEYLAVNDVPWGCNVNMNQYFRLLKIEGDILTLPLSDDSLDLIYFDAFAPEKQPELWSEEIFRKLYRSLRPGGVLTTYCAKGRIRRLLESIGFVAERLPGPPGGKREVLRASKPE